jgi:lipid A 3-O-deacylase
MESTQRTLTPCSMLVFLASIFVVSPNTAFAQSSTDSGFIKPVVEEESDPEKVERETAKHMDATPYKNFLSFSYENDLVGDGKDRYYTSGVRMTYFNPATNLPETLQDAADALPGFRVNDTTSTFFTLGQNLYTPSDVTKRQANPNDRPYAAWLYGSVGMATVVRDHYDELELTLGVVGPEALGEQTQKFIHRHITDSNIPKGWSNQLDFEPGVVLSWQRRWPRGIGGDWHLDLGDDFRFRAEPSVNVSIGNIYTHAGAGMMITFGPYKSVLQDTPPRVKPAMSGTGYFDAPDDQIGWYLFAGMDGRAVARNIFLDGNSFDGNSPSVDKKILVGDAVAGVAFSYSRFRLSYSANYRTKEFDGQEDDTVFGSVTLTTRF